MQKLWGGGTFLRCALKVRKIQDNSKLMLGRWFMRMGGGWKWLNIVVLAALSVQVLLL
jgi:hypothetical protein